MSVHFAYRSHQKELLDQDEIPQQDLFLNLKELDQINTLLGGYNVIYKGVAQLLKPYSAKKEVHILDIGSGGGDTLKKLHNKFSKSYNLQLTGVDLKDDCIKYSLKNNQDINIDFLQSDYRNLVEGDAKQFDIITASLFCHHLTDNELISLFTWMHQNAKVGFVINDIHRHPLAYYSIKWLTKGLSKSYLVKNDAPLSVLRAFKKKELEDLLRRAGITNYSIKWVWAFRWLITVKSVHDG